LGTHARGYANGEWGIPMAIHVQLFIDGKWSDAEDGRSLPIIGPATEGPIGTVAHASTRDLDRALAAAQRGFESWRTVSPLERCKILRKAAELLRTRTGEIARHMTLEQGKPLLEARLELAMSAESIEWFAEEGRRTYGRVIPPRVNGVTQIVSKEPVGPIAAFTPWNFPVSQAVRKVSAAVAAGCSIIVKGPEETPISCAALFKAYEDAGVPSGVVNLVYGTPAEISQYLIPHPVIRKISFTGSTVVGKHLAGLAGQHMKRSTMELGGHSPAIVMADADIDGAAKLLALLKYRNGGQSCIAPTRFLIQEAIYDHFLDRFATVAKAIKVGDGMIEDTTMGPMANGRRIQTFERLITDAQSHGGQVILGGSRIGNKGYYFEPTIVTGAPSHAAAMNEEPFGPIAFVNSVKTLDDAIAESNRLPYGLASYVFTKSSSAAQQAASQIQSGMISINHFGLGLPEAPFGGVKDSGYGSEGGTEAIEAYLNTKFVSHAT
jgi:succinate-semialdehyde dehydrogenase / glutarate-semialdehyde dehydrogenase